MKSHGSVTAACIVFPCPGQVEFGTVEVPEPSPGKIRCRTVFSAPSPGTENRVFVGKQDNARFPLIPGYQNVGEVVDANEAEGFAPGDLVFVGGGTPTGPYQRLWGAHIAYTVTEGAACVKLPEGLAPERAVSAKTAAIALHGVRRGRVAIGDKVVVVGQGTIGNFAAQCALAAGAVVIAVDPREDRLELSRAAGVRSTVLAEPGDAGREATKRRVLDLTDGGADVVIDATGIPGLLADSVAFARPRPWVALAEASPSRIVILGSYVDAAIIPYQSTLFMPEADFLPSRDNARSDIVEALRLMSVGALNPDVLKSERYSYRDAASVYARMLAGEVLRVVFSW